MARWPRFPKRTAVAFILFGLILTALLLQNSGGAGAQSVISEPTTLPGDLGSVAAAGVQDQAHIAKGDDTSLAVWMDSRTILSGGAGTGSQEDIYAARIGADGQVIDTTPIIITQVGYKQSNPRAAWNGQSWLVVWSHQDENDYYKYQIKAARISAAGELLDPTPIVILPDANYGGHTASAVLDDGQGNWVVAWEDSLPQEGTSIPAGVLMTRVSNSGVILDPGGRVIYNHHSQFMANALLARAGDRYLLTFITMGPPYRVWGLLLDSNFNPLRTGPEQIAANASNTNVSSLASNGDTWYVVWSGGGSIHQVYGARVNRNGDPVEPGGIAINSNVGTGGISPRVCWDGQFWFVAYSSAYKHATQEYLTHSDILVTRVTGAGAVLDPSGITVKAEADNQLNPEIAPGVGGGAQVVWTEQLRFDVHTARVSREGVAGADVPFALGAPRQSEVRMASSGNGFLAVFRSEISGTSRILAQHLDANGNPVDAEPFVVSNQPTSDNPSVGWDGSNYLVVWDQIVQPLPGENPPTPLQTFGRIVPVAGAPLTPEFFIMTGDSPDVAGLNGNFLVVNIIAKTRQIRRTQSVRVSGAGVPVGTPFEIEGVFNFVPRAVAFGNRWFAVWEYHGNHDDAPGDIRGAFVEQDGTVGTPFLVGSAGNDRAPHLAVAGDTALVVWSNTDIYGRLVKADGTLPGASVQLVSAPASQLRPSVAWDGNQYVLDWVDHRNEEFPKQPKGDIFGARVSTTNVKLEEFPIADSSLPEETPFVISSGGLTIFSYAKFQPAAPYTAYRITLRKANFPAPDLGVMPAAPTNLVATQKNEGTGSVSLTWTDNSNNETGFKIEARTNTGAWNQVRVVGAGTTTASGFFTGVNDSTSFRVRAYNAAGDSAYSTEASGPIAKMNIFSPSSHVEPANVTVSATASDPEGIARVEFYSSDNGSTYTLLATDTQAPYTYEWTNIPHEYYYVKAKAIDTQGSSTETLYESFVVYAPPTVTTSAPANGATYQPGASIQITASAQTRNNDSGEYFRRMEFYANTTLIGTVEGNFPQYNFTWTNVPTGAYSLTARATTSVFVWGAGSYLTGTSAPVNVTVGNPGANISGRVTTGGTNGLYNVRVTLSGSQSPTMTTTTDADGNYFFTNLPLGVNYTVTPTVTGYTFSPASLFFGNLSGNQTANFTGTAGASVTPDPNAIAIYSQQYDGRGQEASWKQPAGEQIDIEAADDFDLTGTITRVVFGGTRGFQAPSNPPVYGVFVRFYDGSSGTPGALQAEYYLPAGSPGFIYDRTNPGTLDITLPSPFNATGKHFISPQLVTSNNSWGALSANYPNIRGSALLIRNNASGGGGWGPPMFPNDMMFDLYGTLRSTPRVDSASPQTIPRSGLLQINGAYFGAAQGTSQLKIGGQTTPHIITWRDDFIAAYVPESTALGNVPVEIMTPAGAGTTTVNVTTRPTDGRIKWRFTMAGDYARHRSAVGPDGTAYVNDISGRLYALTPDGALKWIFQAGYPGAVGPVTVGADGTIYVAGLVQMDASCPASGGSPFGDAVFAVNPNGTQKWLFNQTCSGIIAGPNVGPDGKIYGVTDYSGIGVFALTPQGTLAYAVDRNVINEHGPSGEEIVFGPSAPGLLPTQQYFQFDQSALDPQGLLFGYTLGGNRVFTAVTVITGQPAVAPFSGNVYAVTFPIGAGTKLRSYTPQGALRWQSPIMVNSGMSAPDVAPDETAYVVADGSILYAVEPATGQVRWAYDDPHIMFDPIVSPDNRLVLMGGRIAFGEPGFFIAVNTQGQLLWKQQLPDVPGLDPYGQVVPSNRPRFTPDGQTAYIASDVLEDRLPRDRVFSYFYALDTSANNVPINEPPKVTMTSPLDGSTHPKVSTINLAATATDDQPVSGVEFYMQRGFENPPVLISTDTSAPYTATFNTTDDGGYSFIAVVRDAGGLVGESRVTIVTSNEPPRITWLSPAPGTNFPTGSTVMLEAKASDLDGTVAKVEFYSNNVGLIGTDTTPDANGNYSINFNPAAGSHNLTAWVTDNDGVRISATSSITVGAAPTPTPTPVPTPVPTPTPIPGTPTIVITSPASGASFAPGSNVTVTADAADSDGTITRVDFFRQGVSGSPLCTDFNPPYTCQVTSGNPDVVNVYAEARDNDGKTTRSQIIQIVFHDPAGQYTISGRLRHISSQPGNEVFIPYALVKLRLGNSPHREMLTDGQGNFSFDHLSRGGDYTVTPSEPGYQFYPPSVAWMGLVEDEYQEFIADGPRPPGPSPTPAPGSNALAWQRFYDSPYNHADYNSNVAIDAQGNTYVTGESGVPGDRGDTDISTVKYSPNGEQLWAKTFAGLGNYKDWPTDIAVDSAGNVYVAGTSWRGSPYSYDLVTIKYDTSGTQQWVRYLNGPLGQSDFGNALALDASGNAIITGYVRSRDPFTAKNFDEFATVKYAPDGTEQWVARRTEAQLSDHAIDVVTDSAGNIYVTGFGYATTGGVQSKDLVTVKYSPAGQELWAVRHDGRPGAPGPNPLPNNPIADEPGGIGLDPSGNVYVFGSNEPGTAEDDFLLLKYNPATGALVWGRNWSGPAYDYARDMAIDASGNAYLTGETYDKVFQNVNDNPSSDAATVKYDPSGNLLWERVYRAFPGKWDGGRHISLDASGNAYVGAYTEGFFNSDTAVIKYQPDGTEAWVYRYDNPNNTSDSLGDMESDADGNLYLTGHATITTPSSSTSVDFVTFKLAASGVTLNSPPEVTLIIGPTIAGNPTTGSDTPPTSGPTIAGRTIKLSSEAFDRDGTVVRVEFYDSGVLIGTDTTSPYAVDWANPSEGMHAVTAMAIDNLGATRTTQTQAVNVTPESETFAISGQLTLNGSPFEGAQVSLGGAQTASATTGADGRYTFAGLAAGGDYTVTPARTGYAFTPSSRAVTALNADQVADFAATSTAGDRINVALASNGAAVTASSQYNSSFPAQAAIDGDRFHLYLPDGRYNIWHSAPAKPKPDWLEVSFAGNKSITQVDVITMQDDYTNAVEPTAEMTSLNYGLSSFEVQYWTGTAWATVTGGSVTGNNKVWRRFTFAPVTTSKVRVVVSATMDAYSRIVEVEAWGKNAEPPPPSARVNFALAANGATAAASSQYNANFPVVAAIDGDRHRLNMPDGRYNMWHSAAGAQKPDWLRVNFAAARVIDEINLVTQQDDYTNAVNPTEATAFTKYGLTSFEVQYWTGTAWATVTGGNVTGNNKVWRKFTFAPITTTSIRVLVHSATDGFSRVWELEAWGNSDTAPPSANVNVALASNGAAVTASSQYNSSFPAQAAIDGDRFHLYLPDGRYNIWHSAPAKPKPDWLEVSFAGNKSITQVDVITMQDDYTNAVEPTAEMTSLNYGLSSFEVQYWTGTAWATVTGGSVTGNNKVWRRFTFAPVTTSKVRVVVSATMDAYSRIVEVEAWGKDAQAPASPSEGTRPAPETN